MTACLINGFKLCRERLAIFICLYSQEIKYEIQILNFSKVSANGNFSALYATWQILLLVLFTILHADFSLDPRAGSTLWHASIALGEQHTW
jgi:hypothetical protein